MNLVKYRKWANKTQQEMADVIGVKRTTYASYEQNLSNPDIESLKKLSQFYRVSIDELVGNNIPTIIHTWELSDEQNANLLILKKLSTSYNLIANGYLLRLLEEQKKQMSN